MLISEWVNMKPITSYTDYRIFLNELIIERKSKGLPCSNRWFAMKMEINSSSWLSSILKGKKGLSKTTANKLSAVLKHTAAEARYFEALVAFNQAKTIKERNQFFQELSSIKNLKEVLQLNINQFDFYSNWYNSAIRSLIGMHKFRSAPEDFESLASMVSPPISVSQARKSIKLLQDLCLIKINDLGFFEPSSSAITSGENIRSLAVSNFQLETMRLAQESLDRHSRDDRYIGTVTIGISSKVFEKIKSVLIDTSNRIAEIANSDLDADRVYQINLQAFPLSVRENRNEDQNKHACRSEQEKTV